MLPQNECLSDTCESDADCAASPNAICAPAGAFGNPVRSCQTAFCKTNADCTAAAGGVCAPIMRGTCCTAPVPLGLACVYSGGCRDSNDCPIIDAPRYCAIDPISHDGVCAIGIVACAQ